MNSDSLSRQSIQLIGSEQHECAVLFVDLRGSTNDSVEPHRAPVTEKKRITTLFGLFKDAVRECIPDFIKSTGDGLMGVWRLNDKERQERRSRLCAVAKIAIDLQQHLSRDLERNLDTGQKQPIGMGLSFGEIAFLDDELIRDYFGYAANLAAKLQDRARPSGLVVQDKYIDEIRECPAIQNTFEAKRVVTGSTLARYGLKACYVTSDVGWTTDWTCLAWPGFASSSTEDFGKDVKRQAFGLNAYGLTVLTHEGLQGKIGTLRIWPRHASQSRGDCFELIIDDFDALSMMVEQSTLQLISSKDDSLPDLREAMKGICPELFSIESQINKKFLFIPIRCGVNALLWNSKFTPDFEPVDSYRLIPNRIESCVSKSASSKPFRIGLYNNLGATLPILILMVSQPGDGIDIETVYDIDSTAMRTICDRLKALTNKCRFRLYERAGSMVDDLTNSVNLALGGGKWLIHPEAEDKSDFVFHLPKNDGGFLWVEGAALTNRAGNHAGDIVEFLVKNVLSESYQESLAHRKPYGSSPVTRDAIRNALKKNSDAPIDEETKQIYKSPRNLNENIFHRRCPKDVPLWLDAWNKILTDCCEDTGR